MGVTCIYYIQLWCDNWSIIFLTHIVFSIFNFVHIYHQMQCLAVVGTMVKEMAAYLVPFLAVELN